MLARKDTRIKSDFSEIIISLASPESILERSRGEVTQPETINYRTYKPEMKGLFCERIFGPVKDWECHCGKYKRIRYKGIICDRCGVEVTEKKVRRERTGHIELVIPVAHTWYFRSLPSKIGNLLGLPTKKLDQIIYYERYVVVQAGIKADEGLSYMDFLTEEEYLNIIDILPRENQLLDDNDPNKFIAKMGAEALEFILSRIDLDTLSIELREQAHTDTSQQRRVEALKRLKVVEAFRDAKTRIANKPEWMIMRIIPVIPPDLRPLVPLDGGKFATSDLNDLYRRVIIRNNRLKRLIDIKAPEVILRNEKRMLQEAVDSLFDNSRKINTVVAEGSRVLKSFSDILKGKQGRFRQNLLGKRVDYSGRSVIVVGPELKLHECGLPKDMAAELFKPFIIRRLIERGIVKTVKSAKKLVEKKTPVVWDILENVLKGHPVLLNRAPTLHRLSIQAFQPKLIEGKAIQLHPLVCAAFNADFDGDQMAVHVPLSHEAIAEASIIMLASHNILNSANGTPLAVPTKDMILGLYYLTKGKKGTPDAPVKGEGMTFYSPEEVIIGIENDEVSIHALIKVRIKERDKNGEMVHHIIETIAGRVVFNQYVPEELGFINELLNSKKLQHITSQVYRLVGTSRATQFLDDVKALGFQYAYKSGVSFALDDIKVPHIKFELIEQAQKDVNAVQENYLMGLITDNERYNQIIDIWTRVNTQVTVFLMQELEEDRQGFNSIFMMMNSGARGSREQVRQLGGMRGLMGKPQKQLQGSVGEIIENPILSNFKEGLDVLEYFISTHGARKGLADTALKTADAGYLTRRLVDVAQDVITTEEDCGTLRGVTITTSINKDEVAESISERILGRVALNDIYYPNTNKLLISAGEEFNEEIAASIETAGIESVEVRSVLTCETRRGICTKCYGRNLATGKLVQIGEAVGVIAAQSIGEPGTQLTLRTFHVGGAAASVAVESNIQATDKGIVSFEDFNTIKTTNSQGEKIDVIISRSCEVRLLDPQDNRILMHKHVPYSAFLRVKQGELVEKGQEICYWDPYNAVILTSIDGTIEFHSIEEGVTYKEEYDEQTGYKEKVIIESKDKTKNPSITVKSTSGESINYNIPVKARLIVEDGSKIKAGHPLVKIPRVVSLSKDITGGLPRVTELFEARDPSNPSIVSEIDGFVTYGPIKRGSREIFVESKDGIKRKYLVPLSKHILVQDNDYIKAGYPISDGNISPSSILNIKGPVAVQEYIAKELQAVYRLQGVKINDKHIEVIVRQMLSKLEVIESGDTTFLPGQTISKFVFREDNDKLLDKKVVTDAGDSKLFRVGQIITARMLDDENANLKRHNLSLIQARDAEPAIARLKLQGITQASLDTKSFISAASFQDTTRVLSEAAIRGKRDRLQGLKENVIVGHLIPTGTGLPRYNKLIVGLKEDYDNLMASREKTMPMENIAQA
ncbi:MAG: DNA-directed RNA polymerase subunit beta' [Candidatus Amoebophilus sp. 36-38]|nr:MAG: DNA-directed RNA polymerase subunit beta' [Candidatus Amoebophilus sp. 36-38]